MRFNIPRLYDSHTHLLATGEFSSGLRLETLSNAADIVGISVEEKYFRGNFIIGFGWDDHNWSVKAHKKILDQHFGSQPVFFSKKDGHSSWLNSAALEALGISSETGILSEIEHLSAWEKLPTFTEAQMRRHLQQACMTFNKAGFTHVRDMNGSSVLWNLLQKMEDQKDLTLAIESNFTFYKIEDLSSAIQEALSAKKSETALLRSKGVKFFFDGSLGSQTAFISKPYPGGTNQGKALWEIAQVEEILKQAWAQKLEVSVHVIGDEASHQIVQTARKVSAQGHVGRLNLEHVQVLRPETIQMMKPLHVHCHMQPCHWLSDRVWLADKLGDLYKYAFPWEALRNAQIPLQFGCDSPIEPPSFFRNLQALEESPQLTGQGRIKKFNGDIQVCHSHPDETFAPSLTTLENGEVIEVVFNGQKLEI